MMKIQGYWEFDEEMASYLGLEDLLQKCEQKYGKKSNKAMTACLLEHLKKRYSDEEEELGLIYEKAEKYISSN